MNDLFKKMKIFSQGPDVLAAVGILTILVVMIVPINTFILDLLLALSLAFSVMIMLVSLYTKRPLDFSTFPSVLLVSTLFRLALNVASTRNILIHGANGSDAAGNIIKAFGEFVVEGNFVVGIVIFIILVIINFMVVTKGAGRVAEVAARFTLDAMPGKQMAIDADLNAGLINDVEAKRRRKEVAEEADFYGSMDGASKFVRGDAIAGILITAINIIGGIIIGVAQNGMDIGLAAERFTLLTVGDGLVTQIPALIISTAAGLLVTRNTNDDNIGSQVQKQFKVHPKAIYISGAVLIFFGLIPGLPKMPFFVMGGMLGFLAYKIEQNKINEDIVEKQKSVEVTKKSTPQNLEELLNMELVELEVGYGLVHLVDTEQNGDLLERITHMRKIFATDWGVIIPSVKIRDNLELKPGGYSVKIKGIQIAKGELMSDYFLAMDPGTVIEKIDGVETTEPVFGLRAVWISEDQKEDAQYNGYTVVDCSTIVATHLTELLKSNLHELFGRQELVRVLDNFKESNPKIVNDLIPDILNLGIVLKVMKNLLRENVSVRDLRTILETLSEYGHTIKDAESLTEFTRQALYRTITERIKSDQGDIPLFTLDRNIEESIAQNIIQTDQGQQLSLDPKVTQIILASLNEKIEEATGMGEKMVILCSPVIRNHFKRLTEKFIPNLVVVSHNELSPDANIRSLGTVRL
jgi:flagellar biosynthesis protein FlhA